MVYIVLRAVIVAIAPIAWQTVSRVAGQYEMGE